MEQKLCKRTNYVLREQKMYKGTKNVQREQKMFLEVHKGPMGAKCYYFVVHFGIELHCVWPCMDIYYLLRSYMVLCGQL